VLAIPLIAFTAAILLADTAKTSSWTLARQNIETLQGDPGCGLADDVLVADQSSMRSLMSAAGKRETAPAWVPPAPVQGLARFALGPAGEISVTLPQLSSGRDIGIFVAGTPGSGIASWRFLAAEELPPQAPGATVVRVSVRSAVAPGAPVAVTAPVTYTNEPLVKRLDGRESLTLVNPGLLTYFPCAQQPRLSGGVVDVPHRLVRATDDQIWSVRNRVTNPFSGVLDLYRVVQLPLTDSSNPPKNVAVFEVEQRIPGAKLAPPTSVTLTS